MRVTYVTVEAGDWEALYIDGRLAPNVEQTHSMDTDSILSAIAEAGKIDYEHFETTDEWAESAGHMPEDLDDIPYDARKTY